MTGSDPKLLHYANGFMCGCVDAGPTSRDGTFSREFRLFSQQNIEFLLCVLVLSRYSQLFYMEQGQTLRRSRSALWRRVTLSWRCDPTKPSVFLFETESILRRQAEATQLRNIVGCLALGITDRTTGFGWAIR
eukprot:COSAG06_NODE_454_length_15536_cov_23.174257_6_plen_133_part_00